jgi:hypothetical protein
MNEKKEISKESILFHQLVLSFHTAAWHQMGKVINPLTQKIEKDLSSAAFSIDMLDMIKSKMKGNLSLKEEQFLDRLLAELKLNYMDELKKSEMEKTASTEKVDTPENG